jgi:hypothetical protein
MTAANYYRELCPMLLGRHLLQSILVVEVTAPSVANETPRIGALSEHPSTILRAWTFPAGFPELRFHGLGTKTKVRQNYDV